MNDGQDKSLIIQVNRGLRRFSIRSVISVPSVAKVSVSSVAKIFVASLLSALLLLAGCGDDQFAGDGNAAPVAESNSAIAGTHDGKVLYELYCIACHGAGPGHPGTMRLEERMSGEQAVLLSRDELPPDYVKTVVREGFKLMPPFRPSEITESQLDALAGYITGESG